MKVFKRILLAFVSLIGLFLAVRAVGRAYYMQVPDGGINESMYVDVGGVRQWVNIYGEDRDNPVLLYLHGGPGSATSAIDYAFTRKWADVYTVVTWDQRNCGKSYSDEQNDTVLTREMFLSDGAAVTEFVLGYLGKEKLTLLGHSWGSIFGANLVLEHPELYECFIGAGQLVDYLENEEAFRREALLWADGDAESLELISRLTPERVTMEHISARNALMEKYGFGMMVNGSDYSLPLTVIFNPNYSIVDWMKYSSWDMGIYLDFFASREFASFSLKGRHEYSVPYYNINGDRDYQTNHALAQEYFDTVVAPYKKMYIMENMTHGLLESDSAGFSEIIHEIAAAESARGGEDMRGKI